MSQLKRVIFMGTPKYAEVILNKIIKDSSFEVVLVITQKDKPVGRKRVLTPPPVKNLALKYKIETLQPDSLKANGVVEVIREKNADYIVVAAFGMLLPKEILDIAPCINLHASILPQYRGASPIQQSILNCDKYGGVTAMIMDEGLDTGDVVGFRFVEVKDLKLNELMETLSYEAGELTISTLKNFENLNPIKQLHANASNCKKIKKEDGLVTLDSADNIYRKFRAFFGWPAIFFENGMKLIDIELVDSDSENRAGEILEIDKESITIGCERGKIKINTLQPKSKPKMAAKAYIVGQRKRVGDSLF